MDAPCPLLPQTRHSALRLRFHTGVRNEPLAFNATDHKALYKIALGNEKDNNAGQE